MSTSSPSGDQNPLPVFISYRHDGDAHCARVRAFARQLETLGFDVIFDEFAIDRQFSGGAPPRGWPHWSITNASGAFSVIAIASAGWFRVFTGAEILEEGLGAASEAETIFHRMYRRGGVNDFLTIGFFNSEDLADLPDYLEKCDRIELTKADRLASLQRWLRRPQSSSGLCPTAVTRGDGVQIPFELPPAADRYFGRGALRTKLAKRLRERKNTVVVGPAGMGKTALAAAAIREVVGTTVESLAASPYPDGVVFLDLYKFQGQAEPVWNSLADAIAGSDFLESRPSAERARQACRQKQLLIVVEGAEEADGREGRTNRTEILSVLSLENRWLLLSRDAAQALAGEKVSLAEPLTQAQATALFDSLCRRQVTVSVRDRILKLLDGHPLALTWAGNLLARADEDPETLAHEWESQPALRLTDPLSSPLAEHTLHWLFDRSIRRLDDTSRSVLESAGLLARAPFFVAAIEATVSNDEAGARAARDGIRVLTQRGLFRLSVMLGSREFTHMLAYRFARNEQHSDTGRRVRLAAWLCDELKKMLAIGGDLSGLNDLLQHSAAVMRADHDRKLWEPLVHDILYNVCNRLQVLIRCDAMHLALTAVSNWLEGLPPAMAEQPNWERERGICVRRLGDLEQDQGNLPSAHRLYSESLCVAQRVAESDCDNLDWQSELAGAFNSLSDLEQLQGHLLEAQNLQEASLRIFQRLVAIEPDNTKWQFDLSRSLHSTAALASSQGSVAEAQRLYSDRLRISQRLQEREPDNADFQRNLAVGLDALGALVKSQGNLVEAQQLYRDCHRISLKLAEADPQSALYQRGLTGSLLNLGDVAIAMGDIAEACRAYNETLEIRFRLVDSDPENTELQRDLCVAFLRLGDLAMSLWSLTEAMQLLGRALDVAQRLAASDLSNVTWQRDVLVSLLKLGELEYRRLNFTGAEENYREALPIAQRLAESDHKNTDRQRDLWFTNFRLAAVLDPFERQTAEPYWEQALAILEKLISSGAFVSEDDLKILQSIRDRVGGQGNGV